MDKPDRTSLACPPTPVWTLCRTIHPAAAAAEETKYKIIHFKMGAYMPNIQLLRS